MMHYITLHCGFNQSCCESDFSKSWNFQLFNFNSFFSEHPAACTATTKSTTPIQRAPYKNLKQCTCINTFITGHMEAAVSLGFIYKPPKSRRTLSPLYGPHSLSPHFCRLCLRELPKVHNALTLNTEFPCYKNNVILDYFIKITTNEYQTIPFPWGLGALRKDSGVGPKSTERGWQLNTLEAVGGASWCTTEPISLIRLHCYSTGWRSRRKRETEEVEKLEVRKRRIR